MGNKTIRKLIKEQNKYITGLEENLKWAITRIYMLSILLIITSFSLLERTINQIAGFIIFMIGLMGIYYALKTTIWRTKF